MINRCDLPLYFFCIFVTICQGIVLVVHRKFNSIQNQSKIFFKAIIRLLMENHYPTPTGPVPPLIASFVSLLNNLIDKSFQLD